MVPEHLVVSALFCEKRSEDSVLERELQAWWKEMQLYWLIDWYSASPGIVFCFCSTSHFGLTNNGKGFPVQGSLDFANGLVKENFFFWFISLLQLPRYEFRVIGCGIQTSLSFNVRPGLVFLSVLMRCIRIRVQRFKSEQVSPSARSSTSLSVFTCT